MFLPFVVFRQTKSLKACREFSKRLIQGEFSLLCRLQPLSIDNHDPPDQGRALRCCAVSLEPRGLYLVHAPLTLLLWVGTHVPVSALVELFNTSCFSSLASGEVRDLGGGLYRRHARAITVTLHPPYRQYPTKTEMKWIYLNRKKIKIFQMHFNSGKM